MKRIALVFLLAILIPSVLLAVLAVRSLRVQELVMDSQRTRLHQGTCDATAADINLFMDDVRTFHGRLVAELVAEKGKDLAGRFDRLVVERWAQASIGAVVDDRGRILSPSGDTPRGAAFLDRHGDFLANRRVVELYRAPELLQDQVRLVTEPPEADPEGVRDDAGDAQQADETAEADEKEARERVSRSTSIARGADREGAVAGAAPSARTRSEGTEARAALRDAPHREPMRQKVAPSSGKLLEFRFDNRPESESGGGTSNRARAPETAESERERASRSASTAREVEALAEQPLLLEEESSNVGATQSPADDTSSLVRNVAPVQQAASAAPSVEGTGADSTRNLSQLEWSAVTQGEVTASGDQGAVGRIIDGRLHLLLWKRHEALPGHTFWTELDLESIQGALAELLAERASAATEAGISLALLDAAGALVTQTSPGFETDWSTPFVAAEVGQILPRWEVAAYRLDPGAASASAHAVWLTLSLLVVVLLAAVAVGSFLVLRSVNHEMRQAARKTDFVSNVSHELKTPLTSIRMFSELLSREGRAGKSEARRYSEVIRDESARLGRLIDRLLDFSRLDRGDLRLEEETLDLAALVRETVAHQRPPNGEDGLALEVRIEADEPLPVRGDGDALSQVLFNLLSNAEKYAAEGGEILVELRRDTEDTAVLAVHDRGPGIPKAHRRRIFEKFHRVDDSMSSGIDGSGIGLALCRRIVEHHGGRIRWAKREGGGSSFLVELPVAKTHEQPQA